jgi:citrate lyase gamma subunit
MSDIKDEVVELLLKDVTAETLTALAAKTVKDVLTSYTVEDSIKKAIKPEIEKAISIIIKEKQFKTAVEETVREIIASKVSVVAVSVLDELLCKIKTKN